jgi:hypothetical protein
MAAPQALPVHEMTFVPRNLVPIQVGRLSASVYPKIEPSMPVFECVHAFQLVKSALETLPVDTRLILDALGTQLNCSAIVDGLMFDWQSPFDSTWYNFCNLAIITFHDSAGTEIKNTTNAGDPAILLPIQNSPKAACHQKDVHFVCVTCSVSFSRLVTISNYGPTTLCIGFYLKLLQMTVAMTNGNNVIYYLTLCHGVSVLLMLTSKEVCTLILALCLQDGPIALCPANFNLGDANIDAITIHKTIHAKILCLRFKQICATIITQLCPGYSDQPHVVLKHIFQMSTGPDGKPVTPTVIEYYQHMLNAMHQFAMQITTQSESVIASSKDSTGLC